MSGSTTGSDSVPTVHAVNGIDTEFLIVGSGPAGAALACFLASYGLKGIMIASTPGTADTPRAHITNMAAMECLRDMGLEREVDQVSSKGSCMMHTRWSHSMARQEFARLHSWCHDPRRKGDYETASPCKPADVPQTLLEPILTRHAVHGGFRLRFDTTLLAFSREALSRRVRDFIGDETPAEVLDVSQWHINEVVADRYSDSNV